MMYESATNRRYIAAYPFALFAAWVAAWIVNLTLRSRIGWDAQTDTIYWIALKLIVWILPVVLAIRLIEREPVARFMDLRDPGNGLLWGFGVGAVLVAVTFLGKTLPSGTTLHTPPLGLVFVNAVVVAPLVEEITLRGFLLKRLELNGHSFWRANTLTTVVFVAMHLPGWYFQGRATTLVGFAQRVAPLAALSLLFGWTRKRSGSLYAAIVLHAINNFYSALFP
jgi:membrane protease YdiL (CAAX protease family)